MKESFVIRTEWKKHLELLSREQRGDLLDACFDYHDSGRLPEGDVMVQLAFSFMRQFFDDSAAKYAQRVEANRRNGQAGGRPKKPDGSLENPERRSACGETRRKGGSGKKPESESESESESEPESEGEGEGGFAAEPGPQAGGRGVCFAPPTVAQVAAYAAERGSVVEAQAFVDFYAAKGWMVGRSPMKDWKAACRSAEKWERWRQTGDGGIPRRRPSFADLAAKMEGNT